MDPHLIQQYLGPPHAPPHTAAPTVEALSHTNAGYNGAPQMRPESTTFRGPIAKPHYLRHPWIHPTYDAKRHPDPMRRFSRAQWTGQTDARTYARTDKPTDRPTATRPKNPCITRSPKKTNCMFLSYAASLPKLSCQFFYILGNPSNRQTKQQIKTLRKYITSLANCEGNRIGCHCSPQKKSKNSKFFLLL